MFYEVMPLEAPVSRILNFILADALHDGAQALRFEPTPRGTRICFEIQGEWREKMRIPDYVHQPLLNCIDSLSGPDGALKIELRDPKLALGFDLILTITKTATESGESFEMVASWNSKPPGKEDLRFDEMIS